MFGQIDNKINKLNNNTVDNTNCINYILERMGTDEKDTIGNGDTKSQ